MSDTDLEYMSTKERAEEYARLSAWLVEVLRLPRLELPAELHRALDRLRRIDELDMEDLAGVTPVPPGTPDRDVQSSGVLTRTTDERRVTGTDGKSYPGEARPR